VRRVQFDRVARSGTRTRTTSLVAALALSFFGCLPDANGLGTTKQTRVLSPDFTLVLRVALVGDSITQQYAPFAQLMLADDALVNARYLGGTNAWEREAYSWVQWVNDLHPADYVVLGDATILGYDGTPPGITAEEYLARYQEVVDAANTNGAVVAVIQLIGPASPDTLSGVDIWITPNPPDHPDVIHYMPEGRHELARRVCVAIGGTCPSSPTPHTQDGLRCLAQRDVLLTTHALPQWPTLHASSAHGSCRANAASSHTS
jgi:hypothetical protein